MINNAIHYLSEVVEVAGDDVLARAVALAGREPRECLRNLVVACLVWPEVALADRASHPNVLLCGGRFQAIISFTGISCQWISVCAMSKLFIPQSPTSGQLASGEDSDANLRDPLVGIARGINPPPLLHFVPRSGLQVD